MRLLSKVDLGLIEEHYNKSKNYAKTAEWASEKFGVPVVGAHIRYWLSKPEPKKMKVLLFDIETAPMLVYSWGLYNQNISHSAIKEDWYVLMWAAKWLGSDKIHFSALNQYKDEERDYAEMCVLQELWNLLNEADIVVAHNGRKFDVRKINAKFLEYGFTQPSYYKIVDTYEISKYNFGTSSHKLDYLANLLGEEGKNSTDFSLWLGCMDGDEKSWKKMIDYCIQDVNVLEKVYNEIKAWDKRHPPVMLDHKHRCNVCGCDELVYDCDYHTTASTFEIYRCNDCGHTQRTRQNIAHDSERKMRMVNV